MAALGVWAAWAVWSPTGPPLAPVPAPWRGPDGSMPHWRRWCRSRRATEHHIDETDTVLFHDTVAMLTERQGPAPLDTAFEPSRPRSRASALSSSRIPVTVTARGGFPNRAR